MKYNRELLKPIFELKSNNTLRQIEYNYGTYRISAWNQFCSKYSKELTLYSDIAEENITRFIQILIDNKHKIDLILQKQNLVRDLLLKDSYFSNLTTQRGGTDTTTNTANSTSNSTQNNTTDTKTVSANSSQNADNKNLTVDKDTQMVIIDELSKNINYDLFTSTNIQTNEDRNTSTMNFGSNSITITKNTAEAVSKILSINIKPLVDDFWNSFKTLFNYNIVFKVEDIVEPNVEYLNTVLRPFIEQQLTNYDLTTLNNRVETYLDNKINLTIDQKDELINQKINTILNQNDNKINELINSTIQTKRGFITTQIENLTNDIKLKIERELTDNVEQLKPELEVKIKELIQNENIPNKVEENINLLSPLINEKVEQAINALSETIKNKVSIRFEELLPIVDLKFKKELSLGELKTALAQLQTEKEKLIEEVNKLTYAQNNLNQTANQLEQQTKDRLTEYFNNYFKEKEKELKDKNLIPQSTFTLQKFFEEFNNEVNNLNDYDPEQKLFPMYSLYHTQPIIIKDNFRSYDRDYNKTIIINDLSTFLQYITSLIVNESTALTIFKNLFTSDNHYRTAPKIAEIAEGAILSMMYRGEIGIEEGEFIINGKKLSEIHKENND